jgi:hypothetical protein
MAETARQGVRLNSGTELHCSQGGNDAWQPMQK